MAYDPAPGSAWPWAKGIPVFAARSSASPAQRARELAVCRDTLASYVAPRPPGAYLRSPTELLDALADVRALFNCGNYGAFPMLPWSDTRCERFDNDACAGWVSGGAANAYFPYAFAERDGVCTKGPGSPFEGFTARPRGHTTPMEEYGHSVFQLAIATVDPEGWIAAGRAMHLALARGSFKKGANEGEGCFGDTNEYATSCFEHVMFGTRFNPAGFAPRDAARLAAVDPWGYCLAVRWFPTNNRWTPCRDTAGFRDVPVPNEASAAGAGAAVDCVARLGELGVRTFPVGADGRTPVAHGYTKRRPSSVFMLD